MTRELRAKLDAYLHATLEWWQSLERTMRDGDQAPLMARSRMHAAGRDWARARTRGQNAG